MSEYNFAIINEHGRVEAIVTTDKTEIYPAPGFIAVPIETHDSTLYGKQYVDGNFINMEV